MRNFGERRQAFTLDDLRAAISGFGEVGDARRSSLQKYLKRLADAGYLRRIGVTPGQAQHIRYRLARDTGPLRPIARSSGEIYDPNTGETLGAAS